MKTEEKIRPEIKMKEERGPKMKTKEKRDNNGINNIRQKQTSKTIFINFGNVKMVQIF